MASDKPDLFGFLKAMNAGDYEYIERMSEKEIKGISPFVLLMWCHGAQSNNVEHVILTDTYCNDKVFSLSKHQKLLLKLFMAANSGFGNTRYAFKKSVSAEKSSEIRLIAEHYKCTYTQAKDYHKILDKNDIEELKELYA